ncbi:hypothetical protein COOONC_22422 [Cooperia oncophora]
MDFFKNYDFVEHRIFNFSQYPDYVEDLRQYRWKPIIIAETLAEFGAIWYMDSSIVFKKNNLSHVHQLVNCRRKVMKRYISIVHIRLFGTIPLPTTTSKV